MSSHRVGRAITALILAALPWAACDGESSSGDPDAGDTETGSDTGSDTTPECTETAAGEFPPGAVEIAWEEAGGDAHLLDMSWNPITGSQGTYTLGETAPMWENVRFDLPAPATIHGARVQWGNLAGEGVRSVTLALHDDFGSNGFDFWQWAALRSGDRCLAPEDAGQWIDYVFDEPLEIPLPGLIHVAHLWAGPDDPLFLFDSQNSNDCNPYDGCHSAFNWPEAEPFQYNGLTLLFPYDYAVRLVVEFHDTIPQEDKWFQVDDALGASGRVAWGDYDNDGDDDLMTSGPTLYRNDGDGGFTDVTAAAGLTGLVGGTGGGVWGDFDNDGCLDYFGLGTGQTAPDVLLRNLCDGTFADATLASGIWDAPTNIDCIAELEEEHAPTEAAAWVDLDGDGFLDLYLAQYECGGLYVDYVDGFWRNEGDGTFSDWTAGHGFLWATARAGRGVSPADCDRDGDVDVFVSNYRLDPNFLFINEGGTVYEWAEFAGLAGENVNGSFGHTIGAAWADFDGDGHFDMVHANLAHPRYYHFSDKTMVLINDGAGNFTDTAAAAGIRYRETHSNPTVADFDNDGDVDLFITCVYDGRFSELYFNDGDGSFEQVNYESGAVIHNGWGSAASDYDNDGDVDLVAYDLFRNDTAAAGNRWLQVRALGGASAAGTVNAAGIGAVIRVQVGAKQLLGHVSGGSGTGCQDSQVVHFGLADATAADSIEVRYPGGAVVTVDGPVAADQRVWIRADGAAGYGWAPPW
jgi:hypothetical protein